MEKDNFISPLLFFSILLTWRETMNKIQLKSFLHDQTCGLIKIFVLRMRVACIMIYQMNITKKLPIK